MAFKDGYVLQLQASLKELAEESILARMEAAESDLRAAGAGVDAANAAVEAAQRELAGAEAGDGRDESNRSLQERVADAENSQASALDSPPLRL